MLLTGAGDGGAEKRERRGWWGLCGARGAHQADGLDSLGVLGQRLRGERVAAREVLGWHQIALGHDDLGCRRGMRVQERDTIQAHACGRPASWLSLEVSTSSFLVAVRYFVFQCLANLV